MRNKLFIFLFACAMTLVWSFSAVAAKPYRLATGWLDEHEAFVMWLAKDKGWDKQAGLDVDMHLYASGISMLDALDRGEWRLGGMGALPAMLGHLRQGISIIGIANDESLCNAVLLTRNSPIAAVRNARQDLPNVLGSAESVKGKTFYVSNGTSAQYTLHVWLKALGLSPDDVNLRNVDQGQALAALKDGSLDGGAALWAPQLFTAQQDGHPIAATVRDCNAAIPVVLVAETAYVNAQPEIAARFLCVYLRAVDFIRAQSVDSLIPDYQRFCAEFGSRHCDERLARNDLQSHPLFTLDEQRALFASTNGAFGTVHQWMRDITAFSHSIGQISDEEKNQLDKADYITDRFLNMVVPADRHAAPSDAH